MYIGLGKNTKERPTVYRVLFEEALDLEMIDDLRKATQKNLEFGRERFKEEVELLYGRRVNPTKTGPKV